jgi:thymidylate kinase
VTEVADEAPRAQAHELIDRAVEDRVLVFGSLPPAGRDLDLLARPEEEAAIASSLSRHGFARRSRQWARFEGCTAYGVEVVPAADWSLPAEELEALFAEAQPLAGSTRLVRPAPHHALLVLARRLGWAGGRFDAKLAARVSEVVAETPEAWERAAERAPAWRAERSLRLLAARHRGEAAPFAAVPLRLRRLRPRRRRRVVVALSGLDGAGKSSHAAWLRDTLVRLGVPAERAWTPLGTSVVLELVGRPAKRLLSLLRFGPVRDVAERSAGGGVMSRPDVAGDRSVLTVVWSTFVLLLNLLAQWRAVVRCRRARVVIFDRHVLDSYVRLRFLYGSRGGALQRRLLRALAPQARFVFLLQIRPETAHERKQDWTPRHLERQAELYRAEAAAFGARTLDAERPKDEVCREIAVEVWQGL